MSDREFAEALHGLTIHQTSEIGRSLTEVERRRDGTVSSVQGRPGAVAPYFSVF